MYVCIHTHATEIFWYGYVHNKYVYVCMCVCVCMYVYTHMPLRSSCTALSAICMCVSMHVCMYTHIWLCTPYILARLYAYMYLPVCVLVHVHSYMYEPISCIDGSQWSYMRSTLAADKERLMHGVCIHIYMHTYTHAWLWADLHINLIKVMLSTDIFQKGFVYYVYACVVYVSICTHMPMYGSMHHHMQKIYTNINT
jgi:hypothetical protein